MNTFSAHHPIFDTYESWTGEVPAGFTADFLGLRTRTSFYLTKAERRRVQPYDGPVSPGLPLFNEEYFEWIDVLEAVDRAEGSFTMVELGAGWGRWLAIGAAAARQRDLSFLLVGVEAEPSHFRWLTEHMDENDIPSDALRLHEAAVAAADGTVPFLVGDAVAWYGQAIDRYAEAAEPPRRGRLRGLARAVALTVLNRREKKALTREVPALSLETVLEGIESVDLIDLDVQGFEAEVLEAGARVLDSKVKRVHIGTHSAENEARCRALFTGLGWIKRNDFPSAGESDTEYGGIMFQDGVQTWINPRLDPGATR